MKINRRKRERGYVLSATSLSLVVIISSAGLAVDMGRVYVVRSEVQAYADAAALAAAAQLNGTSAGITAAQSAAQNVPNKWNFGTQAISNPDIQFAQPNALNTNQPDGSTWTHSPVSAANYIFVQVAANVNVPITLMQSVVPQSTMQVSASAQAGQVMVTTYQDGLIPFSPIAPSPGASDYGLQAGQLYTLRYPSGGGLKKGNVCSGDQNGAYWQNLPSQDKGFWGSNSAAALRGEIVDDTQLVPITIGGDVPLVGGVKNTEGTALNTRVLEDSDATSTTYAQYLLNGQGNGRRVMALP